MYSKEWYQRNKKSIKKSVKKWQQKNKEKIKIYRNSRKEHFQAYHHNYKQEKKSDIYLSIKKREYIIKRTFIQLLGGKCVRCGYDKCIWSLDFHHKNPELKDKSIKWRGNRNAFKRQIVNNEIELLCANCHREEHSKGFIV
jgi:hypothetical protein